MKGKSISIYGRFVIAFFGLIAITTLLYYSFLFISNSTIPKVGGDENHDLYGIVAVVFGMCLAPIPTFLFTWALTGKFAIKIPDAPSLEETDVLLTSSYSSSHQRPFVKISVSRIQLFLSLSWTLGIGYCELLSTSIFAAASDPTVLDIHMSVQDAMKLASTVRGTIVYGSFLPLVAISSFLSGWFYRDKLRFTSLVIPSLVMYGTLNIAAYISSGQITIVQAVRQLILNFHHQPSTGEVSGGELGLIWSFALGLFLLFIMMITLYSWMCARIALYVRRRLVKVKRSNYYE